MIDATEAAERSGAAAAFVAISFDVRPRSDESSSRRRRRLIDWRNQCRAQSRAAAEIAQPPRRRPAQIDQSKCSQLSPVRWRRPESIGAGGGQVSVVALAAASARAKLAPTRWRRRQIGADVAANSVGRISRSQLACKMATRAAKTCLRLFFATRKESPRRPHNLIVRRLSGEGRENVPTAFCLAAAH